MASPSGCPRGCAPFAAARCRAAGRSTTASGCCLKDATCAASSAHAPARALSAWTASRESSCAGAWSPSCSVRGTTLGSDASTRQCTSCASCAACAARSRGEGAQRRARTCYECAVVDARQSRRERREAIVREHMESENRHDFDTTIATFAHPRYEIIPTGDVYDGEDAVRRYF